MSVVAAKVYPDKVVIAADSIMIKGWSKRNTNVTKLYTNIIHMKNVNMKYSQYIKTIIR